MIQPPHESMTDAGNMDKGQVNAALHGLEQVLEHHPLDDDSLHRYHALAADNGQTVRARHFFAALLTKHPRDTK
ncbi:MAG: hypothetical protein HKP58_07880, partial [Desulfatitalea sp.]|nr:hypothetical protein [Desulfatitalea sp.]NNK00319.1 hypothetical protein [Desulfatitalea sp.]